MGVRGSRTNIQPRQGNHKEQNGKTGGVKDTLTSARLAVELSPKQVANILHSTMNRTEGKAETMIRLVWLIKWLKMEMRPRNKRKQRRVFRMLVALEYRRGGGSPSMSPCSSSSHCRNRSPAGRRTSRRILLESLVLPLRI